jgi:hypothetical protein
MPIDHTHVQLAAAAARGNLMARSYRRTKALGLWKVNATVYVAALTIDALQFAQADADMRGIGL